MNFLLGSFINLNREEKKWEEIVSRNVSSSSACSEKKLVPVIVWDVTVFQAQCVTQYTAESFFPSSSTDHHEIPVLREVE